jgi:DNA polymerase (family X)
MSPKTKSYSNQEVAEFLTNIATAYEIKHKNRFEIIAYENAADTVTSYPKSVYEIWQQDKSKLDNIPNIGEGILKKLDYLFYHHALYPGLKRTFKNIHPAVFTLTKINGIGPKIAHKLTQSLKFPKNPAKALEKLIYYCQHHKIDSLPTFGERSEVSILANTLAYLGRQNRMDLKVAQDLANDVIKYLKLKFPTTEFIPLGSLRRQTTTVGDIDIAAKSNQPQKILAYFLNYPQNLQTIDIGPKKASIRIKNDVRIDLMVQPPASFGSLLVHLTGSKNHNILLRRFALSKGLSISEYGIKDLKTGKLYTFETEQKFYDFLGLHYIEPKDRIGENEIDIAKK